MSPHKKEAQQADGQGVEQVRGEHMPLQIVRGGITGQSIPIEALAGALARVAGDPVVDRTGLTKKYDIDLKWTPEGDSGYAPALFSAIQEQLGLKLQPGRAPIRCYWLTTRSGSQPLNEICDHGSISAPPASAWPVILVLKWLYTGQVPHQPSGGRRLPVEVPESYRYAVLSLRIHSGRATSSNAILQAVSRRYFPLPQQSSPSGK